VTDKVAVQHDAERTREGLEAWFSDHDVTDPRVTILPGPQLNGYSHETIIFELSAGGTSMRLVARVEPKERSIFPDPDLSIEYRLLDALVDEPLPLPKLHGYEPSPEYLGCRFYVMDHIEGLVPNEAYPLAGWLLDASPAERAQVWWSGLAALATPHRIDWAAKGLEFINGGRPTGLDGELIYWRNYIDFVGGPIAPSAEAAWTYLERERPSDTHVALCWGDSRLGNQMFRDGHCVALLDWEMASISDPIQDLAWFVHFDDLFSEGLGASRLDGLPPREETIARYEDLTGIEVRNFDYFEIFAAFRFTVILQRLGELQKEIGVQPPDSTFPIDNFASQFLRKLLDEKGIT
jgi:aminoglycoside phosphotransferase (APT) family kinase protein